MFDEHKKEGKLKISEFVEKVKKYRKDIEATTHAFFRLSQKQRKIYTEGELKRIILNQKPVEIIIQKNGNLGAVYRYKNKLLKIILNFTLNKVYIVTFYILNRQQEGEIGK